jgi:hypothetical protein
MLSVASCLIHGASCGKLLKTSSEEHVGNHLEVHLAGGHHDAGHPRAILDKNPNLPTATCQKKKKKNKDMHSTLLDRKRLTEKVGQQQDSVGEGEPVREDHL